jgi:His-Xaa-Ser system protein HxsD
MTEPLWTVDDPRTITIVLDRDLYSPFVAMKAAYELTTHLIVRVTEKTEGISVTFQTREGEIDAPRVAGDYLNRVLDYRLRELLEVETSAIRNVILAHALSRTDLGDERG